MTFAEFIRDKTPNAISRVTGVGIDNIYVWTQRNRLPRRWWPEILVAYPEVQLIDLMRMAEESDAARQRA